MKRVLCLIDTLGIGGAERQMMGLAQLLSKRGYKVDLATYHKHSYFDDPTQWQGVECISIPVDGSKWTKLRAIKRLIKARGGYDCVITYKGGPNAIGCLLKLFGGRFKLIVSERITNSEVGNKRTQFELYRFADVVVPNAYSQQLFMSSHFPWMTKKIVTISNFTDTDTFRPVEVEPHPEIRILTTARVARQKNVLRYLDAVALFKEKAKGIKFHFDWYGEVQSTELDYGEMVSQKVKDLHLEDSITFHNGTNDIASKYQQCDVFCLPSNFEGYPNSVCEAMSSGKPVVASRVCDIPYIVRENENGLMFNPEDINDIAEKLLAVVSMTKDQRDAWGRKGREIAETLFSRDAFVDKYIQLIES